jgi:hypothetical protein
MMERSSLSTLLRLALILAGTAFAGAAVPANALPIGHEAQALMDILLAAPVIEPQRGFKAKMLIPQASSTTRCLWSRITERFF